MSDEEIRAIAIQVASNLSTASVYNLIPNANDIVSYIKGDTE